MIDLIFQNYFVKVANPVYVIQSIPQILFFVAGECRTLFPASRLPITCMKLQSIITKVALISEYRTLQRPKWCPEC